MDWAKNFAEMWERLWDLLIFPILKMFGIDKDEEGNLVEVPTTEAE